MKTVVTNYWLFVVASFVFPVGLTASTNLVATPTNIVDRPLSLTEAITSAIEKNLEVKRYEYVVSVSQSMGQSQI